MKTLCSRCIRQDHCCNYLPPPLQHLHGFGYNGIVRIHLSTWLVLQLEGSAHSVPRDVTLPSLDRRNTAGVHELDTMRDSQAVRIVKGKGKASLLSCGAGLEEKARTSGFTIKSAKFWVLPMRLARDCVAASTYLPARMSDNLQGNRIGVQG